MGHKLKVGDIVEVIDPCGAVDEYHMGEVGRISAVDIVSFADDLITLEGKTDGMFSYRFKLVTKCNGVDAEGNPKQFNHSDLELFQRAYCNKGVEYIVSEDMLGNVVFSSPSPDCMWTSFNMNDDAYDYGHFIDEIYSAPWNAAGLVKPGFKGDLIWKRVRDTPQQKAIKALEKTIAEASRQIELLKQATN